MLSHFVRKYTWLWEVVFGCFYEHKNIRPASSREVFLFKKNLKKGFFGGVFTLFFGGFFGEVKTS